MQVVNVKMVNMMNWGRGKCGTEKCRTGKCETNDVKFEGPKMQY